MHVCIWMYVFGALSTTTALHKHFNKTIQLIAEGNFTFFNLTFFIVFCYFFIAKSRLWPCELQHARLPCPSLSPRVCLNSCALSQWCHPTISSSVTLFSSCPQSFPASGSFPMGRLFESSGRSIGASASASMNIQGWFPLGLTDLISLLSKGL